MKQFFYSHLIEIDSLVTELDTLEFSDNEKNHLASLIDRSLHHSILDAIFSELSEEDKYKLIEVLESRDHQKIWEFLNSRIDSVEDKIKTTANQLKAELHKDIKEVKKIKGVKPKDE